MGDSVAPRTRPARKSIAGASSPAVADGRYAASTSGRDNPSSGLAFNTNVAPRTVNPLRFQVDTESQSGKLPSSVAKVTNKKAVADLVTPFKPPFTTVLPDRSQGSRPSIASTKSNSTTGSSIFDSPVSSPFYESLPTSPEEESDPIPNEATPSKRLPRPKPRGTDDKTLEDFEIDSPVVQARKRKKALSKSRITPSGQKECSRPLTRLELPVVERRRSSSAPSPSELRSSSPDPVSSDIEHCLIPGIESLTLGERNDATISPRTRRASSRALKTLTGKRKDRSSSASIIIEDRATTKARKATVSREFDNEIVESTDRKPSLSFQWPKPHEASQLRIPVQLSTLKDGSQERSNNVPMVMVSSTPSSPDLVPTAGPSARRSRTSLLMQQGAIGITIQQRAHRASKDSSPVGQTKMSKKEAESNSDASNGHNESDSVESDNDSISDSDSPSEAESVSEVHAGLPDIEVIQERDAVPEAEAVHEDEPAADGEAMSPLFERYHDKVLSKRDIQAKLLEIIKAKSEKERGPTKLGRGYIYVYAASTCLQEAKQGSEHAYRYFKIGLTQKQTPAARISQQNECGLIISSIEDKKQRQFKFSGLVDELIKCDLQEHRRKIPCLELKHTKKDGSPSDHGEWYEIDLQRLLDVIEKWRGWVTKCDPFDSAGILRPRWVWKFTLLDQGDDGVDLNHVLQPFTFEERLSRQWDWIVDAWNSHFDRYGNDFRAVTDLFLVTGFIWVMFIYLFYWRLGSWLFVGSFALLLNYLSWR
jgi:hypothetical protein